MSRDFFELMDMFDKIFESPVFTTGVREGYMCPAFPPVNLSIDEKKKDLRFEFAMAGIDQDRVKLAFVGDFMEMNADTFDKDENPRKYLVRGIKQVNSLVQKYYVPSDKYKTDETKAVFKNGILTIDIPAKEEVAAKEVKISIVN